MERSRAAKILKMLTKRKADIVEVTKESDENDVLEVKSSTSNEIQSDSHAEDTPPTPSMTQLTVEVTKESDQNDVLEVKSSTSNEIQSDSHVEDTPPTPSMTQLTVEVTKESDQNDVLEVKSSTSNEIQSDSHAEDTPPTPSMTQLTDIATHEGEPLVLNIDIEGIYNDLDMSHNSNFNDDVLFELEVLEEEVGDKLLEEEVGDKLLEEEVGVKLLEDQHIIAVIETLEVVPENEQINLVDEEICLDEVNLIQNVEKTKKTRKRIADPDLWERNVRKKNRMSGKAYKTSKGVEMPEKKHVPIENCNCRFKCSTKISKEQQKSLFEEYWKLADDDKQKAFVSSLVEEKPVQRQRKRNPNSNRNKTKSRFYFLPDEDKQKHRVCLNFFQEVFQQSFQVIDLALKKSSSSGVYVGSDGRKGRQAPNKTKPEIINLVKQHIDSFPRMESHYCRKNTRKLYLSPELNLAELYRLYKTDCTHKNCEPVSEQTYRTVFKSYDPPLTTYVPKKDQCTKCNQYRRSEDKTLFEEAYQEHRRRKTEAMEMKKKDMEQNNDDNHITATFDLQAVLSVPYAGDAQIYYKRKLSVYNFTIFDSKGDGYCYVWDETCGMKGSSEIGTCLLNYIKDLPQNVTHVTTYSDTCGGQNRNQFIAAALLYAVNKSHVKTIDMKFMESGHSYLEADSMHATIERARKHKCIYTTREWCVLIQMARKKPRPYKIKNLEHSDIMDLTKLGQQIMKNRKTNSHGSKVAWLKVKWLRFEKNEPHTIQYKYELQEDTPFEEINVSFADRKNSADPLIMWENIELSPKYRAKIPISNAKKNDLLSLLKTGVIPASYATAINEIAASEKSKDVVPYIVEGEDDEDFVPVMDCTKSRPVRKTRTNNANCKVKKIN